MSGSDPGSKPGSDDEVAPSIPQPPTSTIQTSSEPPRTLWMGDLDPSFDEATIQQIWENLGKRVYVKLIRAKKNLLIPCSSTNDDGASKGHDLNGIFENSKASNIEGMTVQGSKININGVSFIDPSLTQLHHAGYCFVEFETQSDAQFALSLNSKPIPNFLPETTGQWTNANNQRTFRLNWASGATLQSSIPATPEFSLFVGDLSPSATEADLLSLFQKKFKSVKTVRVMTDPITGTSRCFGFVRFGNEEERRRALMEMNGIWLQGRALRVAYATPRNNTVMHIQSHVQSKAQKQVQGIPTSQDYHINQRNEGYGRNMQMNNSAVSNNGGPMLMKPASNLIPNGSIVENNGTNNYGRNPSNKTVFIGGLAPLVSEHQLHSLFVPFGNVLSVKIPSAKNCGFVRFERRVDAEAAIQGMQGFIVAGNPIRLSWGRNHNSSGSSHNDVANSSILPNNDNNNNTKNSNYNAVTSNNDMNLQDYYQLMQQQQKQQQQQLQIQQQSYHRHHQQQQQIPITPPTKITPSDAMQNQPGLDSSISPTTAMNNHDLFSGWNSVTKGNLAPQWGPHKTSVGGLNSGSQRMGTSTYVTDISAINDMSDNIVIPTYTYNYEPSQPFIPGKNVTNLLSDSNGLSSNSADRAFYDFALPDNQIGHRKTVSQVAAPATIANAASDIRQLNHSML